MTTEEYENEVPRHFFLRRDGYNNKILDERRFVRIQTFFQLMPHMDKGFSWQKFVSAFPLPGDEKGSDNSPKVMTAEKKREIQEMNNKLTMRKLKKK